MPMNRIEICGLCGAKRNIDEPGASPREMNLYDCKLVASSQRPSYGRGLIADARADGLCPECLTVIANAARIAVDVVNAAMARRREACRKQGDGGQVASSDGGESA